MSAELFGQSKANSCCSQRGVSGGGGNSDLTKYEHLMITNRALKAKIKGGFVSGLDDG